MLVKYHTFRSGKKYSYIETESGPVFLRNVAFLTPKDDPETIVVVHEWGKKSNTATWEPPKGQMEWKEFEFPGKSKVATMSEFLQGMKRGLLREIEEEAKIPPRAIHTLRPLPIQYSQDWPDCEVPRARFLYQFWHGTISPTALKTAQRAMHALVERVAHAATGGKENTIPADIREKDAVEFWNPRAGWTPLRGLFSKKMTHMYYKYLERHGV